MWFNEISVRFQVSFGFCPISSHGFGSIPVGWRWDTGGGLANTEGEEKAPKKIMVPKNAVTPESGGPEKVPKPNRFFFFLKIKYSTDLSQSISQIWHKGERGGKERTQHTRIRRRENRPKDVETDKAGKNAERKRVKDDHRGNKTDEKNRGEKRKDKSSVLQFHWLNRERKWRKKYEGICYIKCSLGNGLVPRARFAEVELGKKIFFGG